MQIARKIVNGPKSYN